MSAADEISTIKQQIAELRDAWAAHSASGEHGQAISIENEINALERSVARLTLQEAAEAQASKVNQATLAAHDTLKQIEQHRAARAELDTIVRELEDTARSLEEIMSRLRPAWTRCGTTYPAWQEFSDPDQLAAYRNALGASPAFEPLRLRLRLPTAMSALRIVANRGCNDILVGADARF